MNRELSNPLTRNHNCKSKGKRNEDPLLISFSSYPYVYIQKQDRLEDKVFLV